MLTHAFFEKGGRARPGERVKRCVERISGRETALCGPAVAEPLFIIHEAVRKANRPPRDGGAEICLSAEKMADLHIFSGLPLVKWPQGG